MMRRWPCLLVVVALGCAVPSQEPTVDLQEERDALMKADAAWFARQDDVQASMAFWDEDAIFLPAGAPLARGDAIRVWEEKHRSMPGFNLEWQATSAHVAEAGDIGFTIGTYELTFEQDGAPVVDVGKYVTIWKKQADGSWKVIVDSFNSDTPPPNAADGHLEG